MSQDFAPRSPQPTSAGRFAQTMVAAQCALALLGMAAYIFAPRVDEPVTLLPLNKDASRALPAIISGPGSLMLGRGVIEGSYVVRGPRRGVVESILQDGVLILNASAPGCGPEDGETTI